MAINACWAFSLKRVARRRRRCIAKLSSLAVKLSSLAVKLSSLVAAFSPLLFFGIAAAGSCV
jgi:hypothetical protein